MSVNLNIFYQDGSIPLVKVPIEELEAEETYITVDGSRIKVLEDMDIILIKSSPLNEGERVNTLTPKGLELLYRLLNKQQAPNDSIEL